MTLPVMMYVTDPMCSWCWGFSPVIEEVRRNYTGRANLHLRVGGLRPGNTERFDEQRRNYILGHWHEVHKRTGQPFDFSFRMGPDFTYDTEPAARAVVTVRTLNPDGEWRYFSEIQKAFYARNADVTREPVLTDLAESCELNREEFLQAFRSADIQQRVLEEFDTCRAMGVRGFPTLLGKERAGYRVLTDGYQSFASLAPVIETWLKSIHHS